MVAGILDLSRRLLHELADDETIKTYLSNPTDATNLQAIRRFRKLLMIGRDSLRATSKFKNRPGHPISLLGHSLGVIGDTQGKDPESVEMALLSLRNMPASLDIIDAYQPSEPLAVYKRLDRRLDFKGVSSHYEDFDAENYHSHRIGFRRVVHFGILSNIVNQTDEKELFVATGLQLNTQYGIWHDQMVLQQQAED